MKKNNFLLTVFLAVLLFAGSGCVNLYEDKAAVNAVRSCAFLKNYSNTVISLDTALNMVSSEKHHQIRLNFAELSGSEKLQKLLISSPEKLQAEIVRSEKARIKLNTLLGFHPEIPVRYDSAKALDVPETLPSVSAAWKTALILDGGKNPPEKVLEKVFLAHLEAVAAYDRCEILKFPDEVSRIRALEKRAAAVINLSQAVGISFYMIAFPDSFERRFDRAVEALHR